MVQPSLPDPDHPSDPIQQIAALQAELSRLREQNRFLLAAVNEMASGMIVTDALQPDQPIIFTNQAFCAITGYQPAEILGRNCRFLQGPATDRAAVARLRAAIAEGRPVRERLLNYRKDGQPFWNQIAISPVRDDTGQVIAFVGLQTDVTAQVAVEQALAAREQLLRAVGRMVNVGGWELDIANRRMVWSDEMFAIHELPVGEPPSLEAALAFYPPEVHDQIRAAFNRCLATGEEWDLELPFRTARGHMRWVRSIGQPVWEQGQIRKLRGTFQDITRSKEAELALRASEQRYRLLANFLPGMIVIMFDRDMRITLAAGPELARFGVEPAQLEGRYLLELAPEPYRSQLAPLCAEALLGTIHHLDYVVDREVFDTAIIPLEETPGQISGGLIAARNTTAERDLAASLLRAKEAAEQAERATSAFLAAISHEMRTPLNAVIASAEALLSSSMPTTQQTLMETIRAGGEALLAIVNNVLDLSKLEAGRLDTNPEPTDLRAVINAVLALFQRAAEQKQLQLTATIDPALPPMLVTDGARVRQILINLVGNAIKFTDHGEVAVSVRVVQESPERCDLTLTVRDTGIGIAPDQQYLLFKPFTQLNQEQSRRRGGAGLGLAISAQLACLLGGALNVESQPGNGSTFTLSLSLPQHRSAPNVDRLPAATDATPPAPLNVLVAEDNEINQQVIVHLLSKLGHQVVVVANGADAVQAAQKQAFDVILMDIQMPVMDGEEATRQIRALGNQIRQPRIIAFTAYALEEVRARCLAAGMDGFLTKPVRLPELRQALQPRASLPMPVSNSAPPAQAQLFDWETFNRLMSAFGSDQATVIERLRALIQQEFQNQLTQLETAIRQRDMEQARRIAHRLKGGARQVGATLVASYAQTIEQAAQRQQPLDPLLTQLRSAIDQTLAALETPSVD